MNETKFTEGPWCVSRENPTIIKRDFSMIGSDSGPLIGSTMGHDNSGFYVTNAEAIANAHLFAASLKLYAALVEVREYFEDRADAEIARPGGSFQGNEEMLLFIKIDNLLAQARGDTQ
jgi:hypothetical protein